MVPLRTNVNCPHSGHGSPSYPFKRAWRIRDSRLLGSTLVPPFCAAGAELEPLPLPLP